jgi:hypothetical protein
LLELENANLSTFQGNLDLNSEINGRTKNPSFHSQSSIELLTGSDVMGCDGFRDPRTTTEARVAATPERVFPRVYSETRDLALCSFSKLGGLQTNI